MLFHGGIPVFCPPSIGVAQSINYPQSITPYLQNITHLESTGIWCKIIHFYRGTLINERTSIWIFEFWTQRCGVDYLEWEDMQMTLSLVSSDIMISEIWSRFSGRPHIGSCLGWAGNRQRHEQIFQHVSGNFLANPFFSWIFLVLKQCKRKKDSQGSWNLPFHNWVNTSSRAELPKVFLDSRLVKKDMGSW